MVRPGGAQRLLCVEAGGFTLRTLTGDPLMIVPRPSPLTEDEPYATTLGPT